MNKLKRSRNQERIRKVFFCLNESSTQLGREHLFELCRRPLSTTIVKWSMMTSNDYKYFYPTVTTVENKSYVKTVILSTRLWQLLPQNWYQYKKLNSWNDDDAWKQKIFFLCLITGNNDSDRINQCFYQVVTTVFLINNKKTTTTFSLAVVTIELKVEQWMLGGKRKEITERTKTGQQCQ